MNFGSELYEKVSREWRLVWMSEMATNSDTKVGSIKYQGAVIAYHHSYV